METAETFITELFTNLTPCKIWLESNEFDDISIYYRKGNDLLFEYFFDEDTFFYCNDKVGIILKERFNLTYNQQKRLIKPFAENLINKKGFDIFVEFYFEAEGKNKFLRALPNYNPKKIVRTLE
jgi:hypothetical protein